MYSHDFRREIWYCFQIKNMDDNTKILVSTIVINIGDGTKYFAMTFWCQPW